MGIVKMRVWDVKHGNATFIKTPNDKVLVIDLGRGDYSENSEDRSPLETLYYHYGIRTIDQLTITHPHKDHLDDILSLDGLGFHVSTMNRPKWLDRAEVMKAVRDVDRSKFEKYFNMSENFNIPIEGTSFDYTNSANTGGVSIRHFFTSSLPQTNLNNHSLITILEYEGIKVIIPGDNEYNSLDTLLQQSSFKEAIANSAVLIAPHHGRESAYHGEFVRLANPYITIISDGSLCDTSANQKYSANSRGWRIWKSGQQIERKLLTTNSDGEIYIDFGRSSAVENAFLQVEIK